MVPYFHEGSVHVYRKQAASLAEPMFCLSVFAATVSNPCVHTGHIKIICESEIQHLLFIRWND